jgi:hypothetical protein
VRSHRGNAGCLRGIEGKGGGAAPVEQEAEIGRDETCGSRGEVRGLEGTAGGLDAADWRAAPMGSSQGTGERRLQARGSR